MKLICNTSPLIFLAKIDALELLPRLFVEVMAPPAVVAEVRLGLPAFVQLKGISQLGDAFVRGALGALHRGELEALVLAREAGADLVAVDDRGARRRARELGLTPIGTVGLLLLAHRRGLLDGQALIDRIDALVRTHGLYLSQAILARVKAEAVQSRD